MTMWRKPKLLKHKIKTSFLLLLLASCSSKEYEHIKIEEESSIYLYSCEQNLYDFNTTVQANKAHNYLTTFLEEESKKLIKPYINKIFDNPSTKKELSWFDTLKILKDSFLFQSNIKNSVTTMEAKFGCALLDVQDK